MKIPSEKQIEYADEIARVLEIDFPNGSYDFTAQSYYWFIKKYQKEYNDIVGYVLPLFVEDDDIHYGFDIRLWEY